MINGFINPLQSDKSKNIGGLAPKPVVLRINKNEENVERKSQSNISNKTEKKHHRIIKQAHHQKQLKPMNQKMNPSILDPKQCSVSHFQQHCDTLDHSPTRKSMYNLVSMTFSSTDGSITKERLDSACFFKDQVVDFNLFSQDVVAGKTPMSEFQNLDNEMPSLDLNN